jgi:peroxiredoxin
LDSRVAMSVNLAPDGSFRIDDVPPDEYRLSVSVNDNNTVRERGPFAILGHVFTIPPVPGGRSDEPLDLGFLRLQPAVTLAVGAPAPAFEVTTTDGKKLAVPGDFQGKFLLLDFATLWDTQSALQIARLNDVREKFKDDPRFTLLSLTSAADGPETRKSIKEKGEPWPQAIIGPLSNPIASAYGVSVRQSGLPTTILIGPDGKVAANDLRLAAIAKAVGEALGRK